MQMVVSYTNQYLDHHHHLDQERQHSYRFLKRKKNKDKYEIILLSMELRFLEI